MNMDPANLEVNLDCRSHGRLDVDLSNVLPLLLQQTSKEVSSKLGVDGDLLGFHLNVSNGNVKAHNLLHLELNRGLDLVDLFLHVVATGQEGGELTGLGQTWTQKTWDLLDHVIGGHEEVVTLGKLLDQLLVLVQLLEVLDTHVVDADTVGLLTVGGISKDAALETGTRDGGEFEGTRETFVTDGIVVLQGDLDLDGFGEVTLLAVLFFSANLHLFTVGVSQNVTDGIVEELGVELGHSAIT